MFFDSRTKTWKKSNPVLSADFHFISDNEEDPINDDGMEFEQDSDVDQDMESPQYNVRTMTKLNYYTYCPHYKSMQTLLSLSTVLPAYRVEFLFKPAFPNFKNSCFAGRVISPSEIPVPGFRPSTNSIPLLGQKPCIKFIKFRKY